MILSIVALGASAQETAVFRTRVTEVRIDAQVVDGNKVIPGLTANDFQIFDEGAPQQLTRFGRETEPLALVLLIDVSGSMKKYAREMAKTAQTAVAQLLPQDRVSVMLFARGTETVSDFSGKLNEVHREIEVGIDQHTLPSGTAIYQSILEAAEAIGEYVAKHPDARRAILILTDNESLNYQIGEEQVLTGLSSVSAVLNAIVPKGVSRPKLKVPNGYRNPDFTPTDIFRIAEQSGGEAYRVERLERALPEIFERLRTRYLLIYRAPAAEPGTLRKVRVELTAEARKKYPKAIVRARSGYRAGGS